MKKKYNHIWNYNETCPNCNKTITTHNIKCCEFGNSYCSEECATEYVNKYYIESV